MFCLNVLFAGSTISGNIHGSTPGGDDHDGRCPNRISPVARLNMALRSIDAALDAQRAAVADFRASLAELKAAVSGLGRSMEGLGASLDGIRADASLAMGNAIEAELNADALLQAAKRP